MSTHLLARCKALTQDLMERPLNCYFKSLNSLSLEGYNEIIDHPMDYQIIEDKLKNDKYNSAIDWYNDVCLIYDNAMKYHESRDINFFEIARYCKKEFQKAALGIGFSDPQEWYDLTCQTMKRLSKLIANGPVPQGIDPFILSIVRKAESMPPPNPQSIADLVAKINMLIENMTIKMDVITILKETHSNLTIEGEKLTIDADQLSELTLNSLYLYVKAH